MTSPSQDEKVNEYVKEMSFLMSIGAHVKEAINLVPQLRSGECRDALSDILRDVHVFVEALQSSLKLPELTYSEYADIGIKLSDCRFRLRRTAPDWVDWGVVTGRDKLYCTPPPSPKHEACRRSCQPQVLAAGADHSCQPLCDECMAKVEKGHFPNLYEPSLLDFTQLPGSPSPPRRRRSRYLRALVRHFISHCANGVLQDVREDISEAICSGSCF
jgi:hypothetical protein